MKKWLIILIISLLVSLDFSGCKVSKNKEKPVEILTWARIYNVEKYSTEFKSILETKGNGFIVTGCSYLPNAHNSNFLVVKINAQGNVEWAKVFNDGKDDCAWSIIQTTDNGYLISGDAFTPGERGNYKTDFLMIKVDLQGNVEWAKRLENVWLTYISQTKDGGFIGTGVFAKERDFPLVKFDSKGNVQWAKSYSEEAPCVPQYIIETDDGGFAVSGFTEGFGFTDVGGDIVIKADLYGKVEWANVFRQEGIDSVGASTISETPKGEFIVEATSGIMKLNSKGKMEWDIASSIGSIKSIYQVGVGEFVALCSTHSFGNGFDSFALKFGSNGKVEGITWAKEFDLPFADINTSSQTLDGGFILSGRAYKTSKSEEELAFLAKLNQEGKISGSCNYIKEFDTANIKFKTPKVTSTSVIPPVKSIDLSSVPVQIKTFSVQIQSLLVCENLLRK